MKLGQDHNYSSPAVTQNRRYSESLYGFSLLFILLGLVFSLQQISQLWQGTPMLVNGSTSKQCGIPCGHFPLLLHSLAWYICSGRLHNWWVPRKYSSTCLFTLWEQPSGGEFFGYFCSLVGIFISIFWEWDTISDSIPISPTALLWDIWNSQAGLQA